MRTNPYLFTMASACISGCVGIFLRLLTAAGLTSMQVVALRATIGFMGYTVFLLLTNRSALRIEVKDIGFFLGTGIGHFILMNWGYFNAIESSSMSVAVVLMYLAPVLIVFASAFLYHEPVTANKLLALAVSLCGCALVTGLVPLNQQSVSLKTLLFGLVSAVGYAAYPLIGKTALLKYSASTVSFYTFLFATLIGLPTSGLLTELHLLLSWNAVIGALGIGGFCTIFSYILYNIGLPRVQPGKSSILGTIELFVATILGVMLFQETLTIYKVTGMLCICASVILLNVPTKKSSKKKTESLN